MHCGRSVPPQSPERLAPLPPGRAALMAGRPSRLLAPLGSGPQTYFCIFLKELPTVLKTLLN